MKLGKASTGLDITSKTNEKGRFEFTGLSEGNYTLISTLHFYIDSSIPVDLWMSRKGYQYYQSQSDLKKTSVESPTLETQENEPKNIETAKGKKGLNAVNVKMSKADAEKESASDQTQRKGWDGTVKGGSRYETLEQDASQKTDKSSLTIALRNLQDFKNSFVDLEKLMEKDKRQSLASNKITIQINNVRNRINELENSLKNLGLLGRTAPALTDLDIKLNALERNFSVLFENMIQLGNDYSSISNVLKTKHDTAKNSVGNIR